MSRKTRSILYTVMIFSLVGTLMGCGKKNVKTSEGEVNLGGVQTESVPELKRIHFDFDRYDVRSDAVPVLKSNASWIKENPSKQIVIEGHCDERGTNEYNIALGERRGKATKDYLVNLGIPASTLSVISFGEERPLDFGHDEAAWSANRRAEFLIKK